MRAELLYASGALLTWTGYGLALWAAYLGGKLVSRQSGVDFAQVLRGVLISCLAAGFALFIGAEIIEPKTISIPIFWPIMPFWAWLAGVSLIFLIVRSQQALGSLNPQEKWDRIKSAGIWLGVALLSIWAFRNDRTLTIQIARGAIPLSAPTAIALSLLAVSTVGIMSVTARAARARRRAKAFATHLALITGSILFGIPLAWLVLTSFKEDIDMSSPQGIVWIPRVQETVPYFDPSKPIYSTVSNGTEVEGEIIARLPDNRVRLDINRPVSLRGTTVETSMDRLRPSPRQAPVVTVSVEGSPARGMVIDELEDGHKRVRFLSPKNLEGREQVFAPKDVTAVRKVGLRTQNYSDALEYLPPEARKGITYVRNTIVIVILALIGTTLSSALVAYAFSRLRFPGRDLLFMLMLATMMLPGAVTKLPQFMIFRELGWIDTLYPLWVPAFFGSAFNIFMLRQFFKQIPMELEDAAKIDGAGYLRTFWSVMMPLIKPAIAVIAITTFVGAWNNFLDPLIYVSSPENMTISYAVQLYAADRVAEPGLLTAFTTMSMLPVLALFFFAQRYFIEGVTLTGLGGR